MNTKMGQAGHMGKWESSVAMIRLVRELQERSELTGQDVTAIDNIVYTFMASLPVKVREEVQEG